MPTNVKNVFKKIRQSVSTPKISITFNPEPRLKLVEVTKGFDEAKEKVFVPVYASHHDVSGQLEIRLPDHMMEFQYDEIIMYLVGHIVCPDEDRDSVFLSRKITLKKDPGILTQSETLKFKFDHASLSRDSYYGSLFKCRYFLRGVINRKKIFQSNMKVDQDFVVMNVQKIDPPKPVIMQVGVDECLHIKFQYNNVHLAVDGCLEGHVKVLSNNLKITTMQMQLIRRETIKALNHNKPDMVSTEVLGKFEVMDGYPADGEEIPIRMFISKFKTITNTQIEEQFSVRYFVNLGLIDADGRRYFKTAEIKLFRDKVI